MSNNYYNKSGVPSTGAAGLSQDMRAEFTAVEAGFNKLPTLTGNGGKGVIIDPGGTAMIPDTGGVLAYKTDLAGGVGINVVANGIQTISAAGGLHYVISAGGFSVTGFNDIYNGKIKTLVLPAGLTLVHGASLQLYRQMDRVTYAGDIIVLCNINPTFWTEINYVYAKGKPVCEINRNNVDVTPAAVNTTTLMPYTTAKYDPYGLFNAGASSITVKTPGYYCISHQARVGLTIVGGSALSLNISVNGVVLVSGQQVLVGSIAIPTASAVALLAAGDVVTFSYSLTATSGSLLGSNGITKANLFLID